MHVSLIRKGMTLDGHKIIDVGTVIRQGQKRVKIDLSNNRYRLVKSNGSLQVEGYAGNIPAGPAPSRMPSAPKPLRASRDRGLPSADRWTRTVANCPAYGG